MSKETNILSGDWKVFLLFLAVAQTLASISMIQMLNLNNVSLLRPLINWNLWAVFSFVLFRLLRHGLNTKQSIYRFLFYLIAAAPVVIWLHVVLQSFLLIWIENKPLELSYVFNDKSRIINRLLASLNSYIVLVAGGWAYSRYHSLQRQRLQSSLRESELAEAELKIAKNEVRLGQVLDALSAIRKALKSSIEEAESKTGRLARSLRKSLKSFYNVDNQRDSDDFAKLRRTQKGSKKLWHNALLILAVWTGIAVGSLFLGAAVSIGGQDPFNWAVAIKENLSWYIWAAFTPIVFAVLNRFRLDSFKNAIVHFAFGICLSILAGAIYISVRYVAASNPETSYWNQLRLLIDFPIALDLLIYWGIVAVSASAKFSLKETEEQTRSANLEASLNVAHLNLLRMQLHPHFLFNTLNMVCEFMHEDPELADRILVNIEKYLKYSIDTGKGQEVALSTELELLKFYLQIQEARFQDKLQTRVNVPEDMLNQQVPNLILQPLVENAIRHGLSSEEKMEITVSAEMKEGKALLCISDNGKGITGNVEEGIGISNIRRRLMSLYGGNHMFSIENSRTKGVTVVVGVPYKGSA